MTIEQFIEILAPSFVESGSLLTPETCYKDLGDWNSLAALMLLTSIGQQCGVSLDASDLYEAETIEQLYDIVCARR